MVAFSAINECKTDVYFANGILTEDEDAEKNAKLLDVKIKNKLGKNYNKQIGKVAYAYNSTHGNIPDLLESLLQKFGWNYITDLFIPSHMPDLSLQIKQYKESINSKHKVLVVAHSQGNLFTYEAYTALDDSMKEEFNAISIASPMSADIKKDTPRIDWDNDLVPRIATLGGSPHGSIENKIRSVKWIDKDADIFGLVELDEFETPTTCPDTKYLFKNYLGKVVNNCKSLENGINSGVHAFTFYMGKNLINESKEMKNTDAKEIIMDAIKTNLDENCENHSYITYRIVGYQCHSDFTNPLELVVEVHGAYKKDGLTMVDTISTDSKQRGKITIENNYKRCSNITTTDRRSYLSNYNKDGCSAYILNYISKNIFSLNYAARKLYADRSSCTTYKMSSDTYNAISDSFSVD